MDADFDEVKSIVRSILLALGKTATEREFRKEFHDIEGYSFCSILEKCHTNFFEFMKKLPDVCYVKKIKDETIIQRVSSEESSHMDQLTIIRKKKKAPAPARLRPGNYTIIVRPKRPNGNNPTLYRLSGNTFHQNHTVSNAFPYLTVNQKPSYAQSKLQNRLQISRLPPPPHLSSMKVVSTPLEIKKPNQLSLSSLPPPPHLNMMKDQQSSTKVDEKLKKKSDEIDLNASCSSNFSSVSDDETDQHRKRDEKARLRSEQKIKGFSTENTSKQNPVSVQLQARPDDENDRQKLNKNPETSQPNQFSITNPFVHINSDHLQLAGNVGTKETKLVKDSSVANGSQRIPFARTMDKKRRMSFDVEIFDLISPSQFMFQFNVNELQKTMEELNFHYTNLNDCDEMKIQKMDLGMPVAALKKGKWYRGEIASVNNTGVLIDFVDYGFKHIMQLNDLRYLEKSFTLPSRKACKGSIHGVKPTNGATLWNFDAIMEFVMKTKGKTVPATIKEEKDGIYQLSLIDDIAKRSKVSDFMVERGFAEIDLNVDINMNAILV